MSAPRFLLALAATLVLVPHFFASDEPTLEQRLARLAEGLESARQEAHIPGMSIAIVKDDALVWARGFGLADLASERPADEHTLYAIGSTTKAFTATLIGMLVDEGRMGWDDPVTRYLSYFDLPIRTADESAQVTLRDLLSHRHGFARMGILWHRSPLSREEILRTAVGAEPWDDFRAGFHYCNVAYLAAGEAAGVAAGSTWDQLMVERLLEPLGMSATSLALSEDPRVASGYRWVESRGQNELEERVDLSNIGPAGSIESNVLDMAQWLRLQLGRGEVGGKRLISRERLLETWEPQIAIGGGADYGLGWMLREKDGHRVVEHGGNIGGFSAQVGLMPEQDLGYVLLMNLQTAPLQQSSLGLVFDALLEPWPEESLASDTQQLDYEQYAGTYLANFATFHDEPFEVRVRESGLALHIPSQQTFDLKDPDEKGHWRFVLTDQIEVSFERDEQGEVVGLIVHQAGFHFEVPREGAVSEPEVPAEGLERYTGTYVREVGGKQVELTIEQGRLTLNDRGQRLAFHRPDARGHAALRARADYGATFELDAEGNVESFVFHGEAGDRLFTRLADPRQAELPTLEELLALRRTDARRAALEAARGTRITGRVRFAQAGVGGTLTIDVCDDRYANHMDLGRLGRIDMVATGEQAWSYSSMQGFKTLEGQELTQALLDHPHAVEGDWRQYFDRIEVLRDEILDGRSAHVVRLTRDDAPSRSYWVDAEHGDVLQVKLVAIEGSIRIPMTLRYFDFQERDGIREPRRVEIENPATGRLVMTFEKVQSGLEFGEEVFRLEDPEASVPSKDQ